MVKYHDLTALIKDFRQRLFDGSLAGLELVIDGQLAAEPAWHVQQLLEQAAAFARMDRQAREQEPWKTLRYELARELWKTAAAIDQAEARRMAGLPREK